jgi:predicted lipid-binding transport protein (Tim44 family)
MTIQPNNQAPKFQDPAETPDRTPESRKADAVKEKVERREDKPVAKHSADLKSTDSSDVRQSSDGRQSPEDQTPGDRKSTEDDARAVKKSPEDQASAAKNDSPGSTPAAKKDNEATAAQKAPQNQAPVAARTRLFEEKDVNQFREQWRELQAGFVDEPRGAVREADILVSQMMDTLTAQLAEQKRSLQGQSDAVDTEQLRVALQRYRSLFDQMLQV